MKKPTSSVGFLEEGSPDSDSSAGRLKLLGGWRLVEVEDLTGCPVLAEEYLNKGPVFRLESRMVDNIGAVETLTLPG